MFKTASVLVLRWWLQFRSFISSTSCKKLKLLLYRHVYPSCLRVGDTVEQLQVTVMAYSSMKSRIGCSVYSGKGGKLNTVLCSLSFFWGSTGLSISEYKNSQQLKWLLKHGSWHPAMMFTNLVHTVYQLLPLHTAMPFCFSHQAKMEYHVSVSSSLLLHCYPRTVHNKKLPQPHIKNQVRTARSRS